MYVAKAHNPQQRTIRCAELVNKESVCLYTRNSTHVFVKKYEPSPEQIAIAATTTLPNETTKAAVSAKRTIYHATLEDKLLSSISAKIVKVSY